MGGLRPKQLARIGMFYIEEAILDLLLEAEISTQQGLGPTEISRRLGTYLSGDSYPNAIVYGFLEKLKGEDLIEKVKRGHWLLTEKERRKRRED